MSLFLPHRRVIPKLTFEIVCCGGTRLVRDDHPPRRVGVAVYDELPLEAFADSRWIAAFASKIRKPSGHVRRRPMVGGEHVFSDYGLMRSAEAVPSRSSCKSPLRSYSLVSLLPVYELPSFDNTSVSVSLK